MDRQRDEQIEAWGDRGINRGRDGEKQRWTESTGGVTQWTGVAKTEVVGKMAQ